MPDRKPSPPRNADDPEQSRRFIDIAREVEVDETPGALDRAFNAVVRRPLAKRKSGKTEPSSDRQIGHSADPPEAIS